MKLNAKVMPALVATCLVAPLVTYAAPGGSNPSGATITQVPGGQIVTTPSGHTNSEMTIAIPGTTGTEHLTQHSPATNAPTAPDAWQYNPATTNSNGATTSRYGYSGPDESIKTQTVGTPSGNFNTTFSGTFPAGAAGGTVASHGNTHVSAP